MALCAPAGQRAYRCGRRCGRWPLATWHVLKSRCAEAVNSRTGPPVRQEQPSGDCITQSGSQAASVRSRAKNRLSHPWVFPRWAESGAPVRPSHAGRCPAAGAKARLSGSSFHAREFSFLSVPEPPTPCFRGALSTCHPDSGWVVDVAPTSGWAAGGHFLTPSVQYLPIVSPPSKQPFQGRVKDSAGGSADDHCVLVSSCCSPMRGTGSEAERAGLGGKQSRCFCCR